MSAATVWEMAIKQGLGKLKIPDDLLEVLEAEGFETLSVAPRHALAVSRLPMAEHRDPFDRLLVAQALEEGVPVISADSRFDSYGAERVW